MIGYAVKRGGIILVIVVLAMAVVALAATLVLVQINTAKIAPKLADRWTATDQAEYVAAHRAEVDKIIKREKTAVDVSIGNIDGSIQGIREELAGNRVKLSNIERQLDRIEKKVFDGGYRQGE